MFKMFGDKKVLVNLKPIDPNGMPSWNCQTAAAGNKMLRSGGL